MKHTSHAREMMRPRERTGIWDIADGVGAFQHPQGKIDIDIIMAVRMTDMPWGDFSYYNHPGRTVLRPTT